MPHHDIRVIFFGFRSPLDFAMRTVFFSFKLQNVISLPGWDLLESITGFSRADVHTKVLSQLDSFNDVEQEHILLTAAATYTPARHYFSGKKFHFFYSNLKHFLRFLRHFKSF